MPRYLFWMRMDVDYYELIESELLSVSELCGVRPEDFKLSYHKNSEKPCKLYSKDLRDHYCSYLSDSTSSDFAKQDTTFQNVFLYGTVPSETLARSIFERSLLIKSVVNVWVEARTYDELLKKLLENCKTQIDSYLTGKKWSVKFSRYNNKSSQEDLVRILDHLSPLFANAGDVDLKNPDTKIAIIEKYNVNTRSRHKDLDLIYFGNVISDRTDNSWWNSYSLSTRPILGPTSLENSLSFIMSNLAMVTKGTVVYDPFVGSGGSLISSSIFGGFCFGSDIDMRILRGWSLSYRNSNSDTHYDSSSVFVNFDHYSLPSPDIMRFDIKHPPFKHIRPESNGWVDAIITDPPYGNRASFIHNKLMKTTNDVKYTHCFDLISILLTLSHQLLVKNGRLVFLLPANTSRLDESLKLIDCRNFEVKHIGQQVLTGGATRFVVTLQKN